MFNTKIVVYHYFERFVECCILEIVYLSIKYFWVLDNMTPEEYAKKHLKKPEISNLRGTAFG